MFGSALTYILLFVSLYFEIFLLISFLERRFTQKATEYAPAVPRTYPSVAIIVPCYNEERGIASTLQSLLALEYPADKLEIIVVDDGSTDRTYEIASQFGNSRHGVPRVRIFHKENGGKHTAMNFGLQYANAELVGCLDADSIVAPGALLQATPVFESQKVAAVTPGIHVKETTNMLQHMQKVEYRLSIFNRFMLASLGSAFITPGPFSIFRASVVRELGGWRYGHSTEDMEMALRMQRAGHLIANAPRASVFTATPRTLSHLFRQRVRWTYGFLRNASDYRSMIGNRSFGNLGMMILPCALISIAAGIFFFARILYFGAFALVRECTFIQVTGGIGSPAFNLFYVDTSMMWLIICIAVALILVLISAGSLIGTGSRKPPIGTPLFILFYSFLVPLWLSTAVVRAIFKTGVQWK